MGQQNSVPFFTLKVVCFSPHELKTPHGLFNKAQYDISTYFFKHDRENMVSKKKYTFVFTFDSKTNNIDTIDKR